MSAITNRARRVLIVDDNVAIHDDFRKVLASPGNDAGELEDLEAALFGAVAPARPVQREFELVSAYQGREAYELVQAACAEDRPFAVAFVDMRMPPGWDGLETIEHLWKIDPHLQIVICSAYSDHSWNDVCQRLGDRDALLILKKPFDTIEVVQFAHALTAKWGLEAERRARVASLEEAVRARTAELESVNARLSAELIYRDKMEVELRLAQRLEAIGQLAAGIAHEINTPLQYLGDNLLFVRESMVTLLELAGALRAAGGDPAVLDRLVETADLTFLATQLPGSLDQIDEGVARVSKIVRAMRELSHPGPREASQTDLNHCIRNAIDVTCGAYRMVADVVTELGELPPVTCFPDELNQVFLNLIVNAAHAMEETGTRGVLAIRSRRDGDHVVISVADTGGGIPEEYRERVFDAFFTTKPVGRGTGQGLAISRSIVVEHHHGALTFETSPRGTTFCVRLPIEGAAMRSVRAA